MADFQIAEQSTAFDDIISKELMNHNLEKLNLSQRRHIPDGDLVAKLKFPDIRKKEKNINQTLALMEEMQGFKNYTRLKRRELSLEKTGLDKRSKESLHINDNTSSHLSILPSPS